MTEERTIENDLISRSELVKLIEEKQGYGKYDPNDYEWGYERGVIEARRLIDGSPAVDAEVVRHGHWIFHTETYRYEDDYDVVYSIECSECGRTFWNEAGDIEEGETPDYCFCGCKMDWAKEHPEPKLKTMLEVVLERFPKISIDESDIPSGICPDDLYGEIARCNCKAYSEGERDSVDCCSCWNRPAPEEYQDKEE